MGPTKHFRSGFGKIFVFVTIADIFKKHWQAHYAKCAHRNVHMVIHMEVAL